MCFKIYYLLLLTIVSSIFSIHIYGVDNPIKSFSDLAITEISSGDVSCNGYANGWIKIKITGGTGNYTYNWAHTEENTDSVGNLSGGEYFVTVTDEIGSQVSTSVVLNEPDLLETEINIIDNLVCEGDIDGTLEALISGGAGNYEVSWIRLGTLPQTWDTSYIENLIEGIYELYVTDANQCTAFNNVILSPQSTVQVVSKNPDVIRGHTPPSLNGYHIACYGGTLDSTIIIGKDDYNYELIFPSGDTTRFETDVTIVRDLPAGNYELIVTDQNNCQIVETFNLIQPDSINIGNIEISSYDTYNISCYGKKDGYIHLNNITGGINYNENKYICEWENPAYDSLNQDMAGIIQNKAHQDNLISGEYYLTLKNGTCELKDTFSLFQPEEMKVQATIKSYTGGFNISCYGKSDGEINIDVNGGYIPSGSYKYSWSNGINTSTVTGLSAKTYSLTVEDDISCTTTKSYDLVQPEKININYITSDYSGYQISCKNNQDGYIELNPSGGYKNSYMYKWEVLSGTNIFSDTSKNQMNLSAGIYRVHVKDSNTCFDSVTIQLLEPEELVLINVDTFNLSAIGASDGKILVHVTGGTGQYLYMLNSENSQQDSIFSNLDAGKYKITITDSNNCSLIETDSLEIKEPTLGIPNYWEESSITYFPNPADDKVTFEISNLKTKTIDLKVINSIGSLIVNKEIETPNLQNIIELKTEHLSQGIYFILIDNVRLKTPLIIK